MTAHVPPEVWRARCVEMAESGLGMRQWAESRGINPRTLGAYVTRLRKEEPELLSSEASWCPCPLMRKLRPCADAEARGFLKRVYFEASPPPSAEKGASEENEFRSSILGVVMRRIGPTPTRPDVSSALLRAMVEDGSQPSLAALKATVLAAAGTGFHDGDPIFAWAAENEESLRRKNGGTRLLLMAMESDNLLQVRAIKTIKSGNRSSPFTPIRLGATSGFCAELLNLFIDHQGGTFRQEEQAFLTRFEDSLGFSPSSLDDFSTVTFDRQARWFRDSHGGGRAAPLTRMVRLFYLFLTSLLPPDQGAFTFESGLPPKAFGYPRLVERWLDGYRAVVYEPLDPAPAFAKWLLYPNDSESRKASHRPDTCVPIDCSVGDPMLERALIEWLWAGEVASLAVRGAPPWVVALLEGVVSDGYSIIGNASSKRLVRPEVVSSTLVRSPKRGKATVCNRAHRAEICSFLRFAESRGFLGVDPACYLLLESSNCEGRVMIDHPPAPSPEALSALAGELEPASCESLPAELTYVAFVTQALTPLRIGEVLSLRTSDLDVLTSGGAAAVRVCRKSGGYAYELIEIPGEVSRLLHAVVRATEPVRAVADESIRDRVFLTSDRTRGARLFCTSGYACRLAAACDRLGIPRITPSDVRRGYQTTVVMEGAKRHWSRMLLRPITGHADIGSDEFYVAPDIMSPQTRRYLEGAYVVEIGSPKIRGSVVPDDEIACDVATLVEGGSGVCRNAECDVLGTLPCFECRGFATSPRFIPEMQELIAAIEEQSSSAPPHQRKHLMSAKRHALAYLGAMIDAKERG